jgi:putative ubiquitin-RnfH superfamily antitoxin RatB of RatAB toxin-antitoxin module
VSGITITVVYAPAARQVHEVTLSLPAGSTVRAAIDASGLLARFADIDLSAGAVGVWGRKTPPDYILRERDRVEIWRPLRADPKLARRERFGKQGARAAGLFAQRRAGGKPGY